MRDYFRMFWLCLHKAFKSKQVARNNLYNYIIDPFFTAVLFCLMNSEQDSKVILAGVSIIVIWSINIFECSYLMIDEKAEGTLGAILISPFQTQFLLFSEVLCTMILSIPAIIVVFLAGWCIMPFSFSLSELPYLIWAYFLCILAISTIGLLLASLLLFTRSARGIMNIIEYPFYLLSGVIVPVERFPACFRWICELLPTTHALRLLQSSPFHFAKARESSLKCLLEIAIFHLIIAVVIQFTKKQALIKGTIDLY